MKRRKKKRIVSVSLLVIAIVLIITCIGYPIHLDNQKKIDEIKIDNKVAENKVYNKREQSQSTKKQSQFTEEDATRELFDKFLNGEIDADAINEGEEYEYTLNVDELDLGGNDWDSSSVYGYLDVDNDGEDELIITNAYGASLFDAKDGKVKMFASGGGTGNTVLLANYENAYWVVHAFSSADCYAYSMFKYNGVDSIDEKLCFGYEIDESGKEIYYKEIDSGEEIDITQEEYKSLIDTIIPFK